MLSLTLTQNRRIVQCNKKSGLFVSLEVAPDESTQLIQKTHHVALAIDCSGSMYGDPLEDAKNAAIQAVRSLSPNDLVSIVSFESEVKVELSATPANDPNVVNVINSLEVEGATALHGGIDRAFGLLQQSRAISEIKRLMVFTDGEPTVPPYEDQDFEQQAKSIRSAGVTLDVFGIGIDYNEILTKKIAECGGGKWEHVENSSDLQSTVMVQMTEMQNTVISNPQLEINLMDGAELAEASITNPVLEEINLKEHQRGSNKIIFGIKDIIKEQSQTIVMRIAVPPIQSTQPIPLVTAAIVEGNNEVAHATAEISCSDEPELYNLEANPDPRVLFQSGKATILNQKGIEGDQEATIMAQTILKSLEQDTTSGELGTDAQATVINAQTVGGNLKPGMTEAQKKTILHESTKIGQKSTVTCPHCAASVKLGVKFCGKCGRPINEQEESK